MRWTGGSPPEDDRCSLRWWINRARSSVFSLFTHHATSLALSGSIPQRARYPLCLKTWLWAWGALRSLEVLANGEVGGRACVANPAALHGCTARPYSTKFRAVRWMHHVDRRAPTSGWGTPLTLPCGAPSEAHPAIRVKQSILPRQRTAPRDRPEPAGPAGRAALSPRGGSERQLPVPRRHARTGGRFRPLSSGSGLLWRFRRPLYCGVRVPCVSRLALRRWRLTLSGPRIRARF